MRRLADEKRGYDYLGVIIITMWWFDSLLNSCKSYAYLKYFIKDKYRHMVISHVYLLNK